MPISLSKNREGKEKSPRKGLGIILDLFKKDKNKQKFERYVEEQKEVQDILNEVKLETPKTDLEELKKEINPELNEEPKKVINSVDALLAEVLQSADMQLSQTQKEVWKTRNTLVNAYGSKERSVSRKVFEARIDDIGMKYLFVAKLLQKTLNNKEFFTAQGIQLGENLYFFQQDLDTFIAKLEDPQSYLPEDFLSFFDGFRTEFKAWDKLGLTPELLKQLQIQAQLADMSEVKELLAHIA